MWQNEVLALTHHPNGRILASGSANNNICLWDTESGKHLFTIKAHNDDVRCLAFSPDGKKLASGSADTTIKIWKLEW